MSQLFRSTSKKQTSEAKTQKANEAYWASDAVDRIARRTPALFKTNRVPTVHIKSLTLTDYPMEGSS